ncbi:hypothetical protein BUALT_Bualt05G0072000 [Buddleja alternifolia]|uniref:Uncharacterized protein n=1 Tax=Buddleja alternifolia TaxID=168488 RepID=A0AAV6XHB9_9LAMI|nr:hypothetical protein BUALT_Bualt05G0072000 [Buddleja alternifolia]
MADAAVGFLLDSVTELLKSYVSLISSAEDEFKNLRKDLAMLKGYLQDAAKEPQKKESFREVERQIRDVVYYAEDTIDTCLTERSRSKILKIGISLAKQVKALREDKVIPMLETARKAFVDIQRAEGSNKGGEQPLVKQRKAPSIRKDNVVGFEDEEKTLMGYLLDDQAEELDVISIIGMPGLGKTTLAWKIFDGPDIRYEFPTRIWIYVSQVFNKKDVFLNIMKRFTGNDMSYLSEQELAGAVSESLKNGKFLLVLDDVWTPEAWNEIRNALPTNNSLGRVLITSREKKVGLHANPHREPHMLRFLTEEESWKLLQYEVFGRLDSYPPQLEEIGQYIAKQCDGLPLAAVIIGGILTDQFSRPRAVSVIKEAWTKVSENVSRQVKDYKGQNILEIVEMSYDNLPDEFRDCFIYLGVFPEDYMIPAWTLTHLWISEGFIQRREGLSLEESAEEILNELISRNLVMVDKTNLSGDVKIIRVHDVIREFCKSRAGVKEHNLFEEIIMSNDYPPISDIQMYRRICIHSHLPTFLSKKPKDLRARSFLCFYKEPIDLPATYISTISDACSLLRVFESKSFKFHQFPAKVTKLIHLRYITLSCDELNVLPKTISELWNLQTLVVDTKSRTLTIKASLWKMIQLRHVKTKASIILPVQDEGRGGDNLQTLSRLSPEECTKNIFNKARNLKILGVRGKIDLFCSAKSLENVESLENLKLVNDSYYDSATENVLRSFQRNSFPKKLRRLTISDFIFWEASHDSFPSLRCLVLKNCQQLRRIPLELEKSLQLLDIERVGKSAAASAREIEKIKKDKATQTKGRCGGAGFKLEVAPGCE